MLRRITEHVAPFEWKKNRKGLYDCPTTGYNTCRDHKGENGFKTIAQASAHVMQAHEKLWNSGRFSIEATDNGHATAAAPPDPDTLAGQPGPIVEDIERLTQDFTPRVQELQQAKRPAAAAAATDILNLPSVYGMTSRQLEKLMAHVVAIKALDEGDTQGTGFRTDHLDELASSRPQANASRARELADINS